jgi:hypothetical protein
VRKKVKLKCLLHLSQRQEAAVDAVVEAHVVDAAEAVAAAEVAGVEGVEEEESRKRPHPPQKLLVMLLPFFHLQKMMMINRPIRAHPTAMPSQPCDYTTFTLRKVPRMKTKKQLKMTIARLSLIA